MSRFMKGERPWLPSGESHDLDVLLEYEGPIVGTFRDSDGTTYLFSLIIGDMGSLQVWGYCRISEADVRFIDSDPFGTPEDVRVWAGAKIEAHARYVALSLNDYIECHADVARPGGPIDAAMLVVQAYIDQSKEEIESLQRGPHTEEAGRVQAVYSGLIEEGRELIRARV